MARFDVYRNPARQRARRTPFLLDVQSGFLEGLETRVVVPLRTPQVVEHPMTRLNPMLSIEGTQVVMDTSQLAGYPRGALKRPVANLAAQAFEIQDALDFLFAGI